MSLHICDVERNRRVRRLPANRATLRLPPPYYLARAGGGQERLLRGGWPVAANTRRVRNGMEGGCLYRMEGCQRYACRCRAAHAHCSRDSAASALRYRTFKAMYGVHTGYLPCLPGRVGVPSLFVRCAVQESMTVVAIHYHAARQTPPPPNASALYLRWCACWKSVSYLGAFYYCLPWRLLAACA